MSRSPEIAFQQHIADFLVRVHGYGVLEQSDITDTEHFIAEDQLWAFLNATQADTLKKLKDDYGTDARDEIFRALRKELEHTPLWMIMRQGLKVRGLEFRLYYPKPRSAESAAVRARMTGAVADTSSRSFTRSPVEPESASRSNGGRRAARTRPARRELTGACSAASRFRPVASCA